MTGEFGFYHSLKLLFPSLFASYWSDGLEDLISTQYLTICLTITNLFILLFAPIIGLFQIL